LIRLVLKEGRDAALRRRHPWLFSGAVARTQAEAEAGAKAGADASDGVVEVWSASGERLAAGAHSPGSQIVARLWSFGDDPPPGPELFRTRFAAARALRDRVVPAATTGFRAVNSEGDRCPGVTLDLYGGVGILDLSTEGTERWEESLSEAARGAFAVERLVVRRTGASRDRGERAPERKAETATPTHEGSDDRVPFTEHGLAFFADLAAGQKTGFFLDQRDNRARARSLAGGLRVLNLFSYTGAFSVAALAGGAVRAVDVDASARALDLAAEHRRANGFPAPPEDFVRADVFEDLRERVAAGEVWDLVICDPPAFAKKRGDVDRAARGYKDVNRLAMRLVAPGGTLLTCSCSGAIDPTLFQQIVFAAEIESRGAFSLVARQGAGADHPVSLDCPEGEYLKGLWLVRSS
jgi:23S rRNA (cytosine1962-C5)-methyltransferase